MQQQWDHIQEQAKLVKLQCCIASLLQGLWWLPSIADADRLQPLRRGSAMAAAAADDPGRGPRKLVKLQLFIASSSNGYCRGCGGCPALLMQTGCSP